MPLRELTEVFLALLHSIAGLNRRCRGRHGGRCLVPAVAPPLQSSSLAPPHHRVLERPPSPSPDRATYRPMEPSDPDDSQWSHRVVPCAVHGWACPNRVAPAQGASSSGIQGEEEGREEDEDDDRLGGRQPRWAAGNTPDYADLHRSKGPTPRTADTMDRHHAAKLADPFPRRARTTIIASFKRGWPFRFRIAVGTA
jgi:hypothetical protein